MAKMNPDSSMKGGLMKKLSIMACCCVWLTVEMSKPRPSVVDHDAGGLDAEDGQEDTHLDQAEDAEPADQHRPRVEEDHLDVEDDEHQREQVVAVVAVNQPAVHERRPRKQVRRRIAGQASPSVARNSAALTTIKSAKLRTASTMVATAVTT